MNTISNATGHYRLCNSGNSLLLTLCVSKTKEVYSGSGLFRVVRVITRQSHVSDISIYDNTIHVHITQTLVK